MNNERAQLRTPKLEVSPLLQSRGQWKILSADKATFTVSAPGARRVRILDRPEGVEGQVELVTLHSPPDPATGKFAIELNFPQDFAGELWAEVTYPDNLIRETDSIALTTATAINNDAKTLPLQSAGGSVGTD